MKRFLGLILCLMLLMSLAAHAQAEYKYAGSSPLVGEGETYTIKILGPNSSVSNVDFTNDPIVDYLFSKTGIQVELELLDATTYNEAVKARLAAGVDLPDIVRLPTTDFMLSYVKSGLFIDLTPYYETDGIHSRYRWEKAEILEDVFASDGKLYYVPTIAMTNTLVRQTMINVNWLHKAGLDMPTDIDEFYDMLVHFRDHDMDGDGDASNEVPFTPGSGKNIGPFASFWGIDIETGFSLKEDGTVRSDWQSEEYKSFLTYMNKLYREGLVAGNLFTISTDEIKALAANNSLGALVHWGFQQYGYYRYFENIWDEPIIMGVKPLSTEYGEGTYWNRMPINGMSGVTKYCEHPDIAFRLLDWCVSDEALNINLYGIENVDWKYGDQGEIVFLGEQAEDVSVWRANHFAEKLFIPIVNIAQSEYYTVPKWLGERDAYLSQYYKKPLTIYYRTDSQNEILNQYLPDIQTYQSEAMQLFITGQRDLREWDEYCATLDKLGIEEVRRLYQDYVI